MRLLGFLIASIFRIPFILFFFLGFYGGIQTAIALPNATFIQWVAAIWFASFWLTATFIVSRFDELFLYNPYHNRTALDIGGDLPQIVPSMITGSIGLAGWILAYIPLMAAYPEAVQQIDLIP